MEEECIDPDCDCHNRHGGREVVQLELPDEFLPKPKEKECESE